jgi:hypothetical protein
VRVLRSPSGIVEAESAENGVLLAGEVSADVSSLLLSMDEAGYGARGKGIVIKHRFFFRYILIYINNIMFVVPFLFNYQ